MRLEGKTVVIMGAGQSPGQGVGNGRATALLFAREGARVLCVDRDHVSAVETAGMITGDGGEAATFEADVTREAQVAAAVEECRRLWGRLDILHNNVGISVAGGDAEVTEITEDAFDRVMAVNLRGTVMACKHAIPIMREQRSGAIVNISSVAAVESYPWVAYKASKMGMVAFTKQIAIQNAKYGIRANVILPGVMDTPMAVDTRGPCLEPPARGDRGGARCAGASGRKDGHGLGRCVRRPLPRIRRGPFRDRRRAARRRRHRLPHRIAASPTMRSHARIDVAAGAGRGASRRLARACLVGMDYPQFGDRRLTCV